MIFFLRLFIDYDRSKIKAILLVNINFINFKFKIKTQN
jgi:hypothetical protein